MKSGSVRRRATPSPCRGRRAGIWPTRSRRMRGWRRRFELCFKPFGFLAALALSGVVPEPPSAFPILNKGSTSPRNASVDRLARVHMEAIHGTHLHPLIVQERESGARAGPVGRCIKQTLERLFPRAARVTRQHVCRSFLPHHAHHRPVTRLDGGDGDRLAFGQRRRDRLIECVIRGRHWRRCATGGQNDQRQRHCEPGKRRTSSATDHGESFLQSTFAIYCSAFRCRKHLRTAHENARRIAPAGASISR